MTNALPGGIIEPLTPKHHGPVAQLGAHYIRIVGVVGSNPIRSTKKDTTQRVVSFLVWYSQIGFEKLNATRMSVAGEGWTEPNLHFRLRKCKRIRQVHIFTTQRVVSF